MCEQPPTREIESSQSAYAPANERRGKRRVRVSLQLRIQPLEFSDGNFEEVRTPCLRDWKVIATQSGVTASAGRSSPLPS
jgi:hypothetical protein